MLDNAKHERFCQEFAVSGDRSKAYVAAGFSERGAYQNSCRLLKDDKIASRIREIRTKIESAVEKAGVQIAVRDRAARVDMASRILTKMDRTLADKDTLGPGDMAIVKEVRSYLQHIAQELGQWTEKTEVTSNVAVYDVAALAAKYPPEALQALVALTGAIEAGTLSADALVRIGPIVECQALPAGDPQ